MRPRDEGSGNAPGKFRDMLEGDVDAGCNETDALLCGSRSEEGEAAPAGDGGQTEDSGNEKKRGKDCERVSLVDNADGRRESNNVSISLEVKLD